MTETNDKLLKQFFGEQKQEIEDNGFSRRVMRNLPGRNHRLVRAWGAACAVVCVILFFTLGGLQATISTLREVFVSMVQQSATTGFDPKSLYIAAWYLPSSERARHGRWHNTQRSYESNAGYSI